MVTDGLFRVQGSSAAEGLESEGRREHHQENQHLTEQVRNHWVFL